MPFDDLSSQEEWGWIGESFADGLSSHLLASGSRVVGLAEREGYLRDKGLTPGAPLTRATVILAGLELGAGWAIMGSYRVDGDELEVSARVIDLVRGAIVGVIEDRGSTGEVLALQNRLAKNILRLEGQTVPEAFEENARRRLMIPLEAYQVLARARMAQDSEERRRQLERALELHPDYTEARLLLGQQLLGSGRAREAIDVLSAAQPEAVFYRDAYFLLGMAYLEAAEAELAAEVFGQLAGMSEDPVFHNNLGVAHMRAAQLEPAIAAFQRAVELAPDEPTYRFNLGWGHWRSGKGGEAYRWLKEAVNAHPSDGRARLLLSAAAASQARAEEAAEEREIALSLDPELSTVAPSTVTGWERVVGGPTTLGTSLAITGASASAETALSAEPLETRLERSRELRASDQLDAAIRELERALYLDPHATEARLELASIHRESGALEKAVGQLRVALWEREEARTHLELAEVYTELEQWSEAESHLQRALELDPESEEARELEERLTARMSP